MVPGESAGVSWLGDDAWPLSFGHGSSQLISHLNQECAHQRMKLHEVPLTQVLMSAFVALESGFDAIEILPVLFWSLH